jgi:hypothetical protein
MISNSFLTIVVPTYKRGPLAAQRAEEFITFSTDLDVDLLIIDNKSGINEISFLGKVPIHERVNIVYNNKNIGFAGSFARAFRLVTSEYLLFISDQDKIDYDSLSHLISFLKKFNPGFLSCQVGIKGKQIRGMEGPIDLTEYFSCSSHIFGLVFNRNQSINTVKYIDRHRNSKSLVNLYPQTVLAMYYLVKENAFWWSKELVISTQSEEDSAAWPTHIQDEPTGTSRYWELPSRWKLLVDQRDFSIQLGRDADSCREKIIASRLSDFIERRVFYWIRDCIAITDKEFLESFEKEAKLYGLKFYLRKIKGKLYQIIKPSLSS